MHRRGFTLIELLVVIAIIAILAMLLFPVFVKAMDNAKMAKCVAHGHELYKACAMYIDDWDGRFPRALSQAECDALPRLGPYDWPGTPTIIDPPWKPDVAQYRLVQLKPYVRNKEIWICPGPKGDYTTRYAYGYQCSWLPRDADGYSQGFVDGDRGFQDSESGSGRTIVEVQALDLQKGNICGARYLPPSRKIMWMCYAFGDYGNTLIASGGNGWRQNMFPDYPHGDGSVFVYADGHAARKRMGMAWAPVGYTKVWMDQDPGK
jgi:prepilin-type N-terminal cleavage/methylation domain-containing protein/prepilin-type processing-associated H-X9-DG protein